MNQTSEVVIRYRVEGFHHWQSAPMERAYLGYRHRHQFHVEVSVQVFEDDREIEFHDLLDFCKVTFPGGQLLGQSCEQMAKGLREQISLKYGADRAVSVGIFEDGEVGAVVRHTP